MIMTFKQRIKLNHNIYTRCCWELLRKVWNQSNLYHLCKRTQQLPTMCHFTSACMKRWTYERTDYFVKTKISWMQIKITKFFTHGAPLRAVGALEPHQENHLNRPFLSFPGPLFQNEGRCSAFDMKSFFTLMQIKLIFTRKVVHLASFWKWGFLELRSGLLKLKMTGYFPGYSFYSACSESIVSKILQTRLKKKGSLKAHVHAQKQIGKAPQILGTVLMANPTQLKTFLP